MGMLMIAIAVGLFASIIIFFIAEEMSLKDANFSDMKCLVTEEISMDECLTKYKTVKYMVMYVTIVFFIGLVVSTQVMIPETFTLGLILAYVFLPALIGWLIILLVKWRYQPVLKILSSFMFAAGYMSASAFAIAITYLFLT